VRALGLFAWPWPLSADYSCCEIPVVGRTLLPRPPVAGGEATFAVTEADVVRVVVSSAILLACAWWIVRQRALNPARCFFAVFAAITWLPASNLLVIIGTVLAERTLYLPLAGVSAVIASLLEEVRLRQPQPRARAVTAGLIGILALGAVATWMRNLDWRDDQSLWASAVQAVPGSAKAHAGLAAAAFSAGATGAGLDAVIAHGEQAIAIRPDYRNALVALGGHYTRRGEELTAASRAGEATARFARAVEVLERAKSYDQGGDDPNLYNNLSLAYFRGGRLTEALAAYQRSRDLEPLKPRRHADIAVVLTQLGRWDEAARELFIAATLAPEDGELRHWLAEAYRRGPDTARAVIDTQPGQAQINIDDPTVRRHRCEALTKVARIREGAGEADAAKELRAEWGKSCLEE
jgi:tetratricopeptide (TPR) repeat protein